LKSINESNYGWLEISTVANIFNGIISVTHWDAYPIPLDSGLQIFNLGSYTNGESYESTGIFMIDCGVDCYYG
jgi:hypothetical protein